MINATYWQKKRVFITGHTGMKGTWLSVWLSKLGAEVFGYSIDQPSNPSMHSLIYKQHYDGFYEGDVRDYNSLKKIIDHIRPDVIFHMAAQSLVRHSYLDPLYTYTTNVMGTVNVLEIARQYSSIAAVVCITSDKCYQNDGFDTKFKENDKLGGNDPYSSSKGCAELVVSAYNESYFRETNSPVIVSVRAGNVIGGGDWAEDRLIPDLFRAIDFGHPVIIRNPNSVRPWHHVLDCLSGYLALTQKIFVSGNEFAGAWNFGPTEDYNKPVSYIVDRVSNLWGDELKWETTPDRDNKEAQALSLDSSKAVKRLGWKPRLDLDDALKLTTNWYRGYKDGDDLLELTLHQIRNYEAI